jgi:hypothetical protein
MATQSVSLRQLQSMLLREDIRTAVKVILKADARVQLWLHDGETLMVQIPVPASQSPLMPYRPRYRRSPGKLAIIASM